MRRRLFIAGVIGVALGRSIELSACGDKFLRVGRGARFRRYAAAYPVAILIYPPVNSTRAGIDELKQFLKLAGHKPVVLDRHASVSAALKATPYEVVIADYGEADRLKAEVRSAGSQPVLLPILNNPEKDLEVAARRQYAFLIRPHAMTKFDALEEIDRLMESKSRITASSNPSTRP